jgi:hypothetical protein
MDGSRHGRWRRKMERVIRLDDADWSKHVTRDDHRMTPLRVSGLRLRIMECMAFTVLVSNATRLTLHHSY